MDLKASKGKIIVIDRERKRSFLRSSKDKGSVFVPEVSLRESDFQYSFKSILSIYYVSGTIVGHEDMVGNKSEEVLSS